MLVFSRRPGESFFIGDHIEVRVVEIHKSKCKLSIKAPPEVRIARQEVWAAIHDQRDGTEPQGRPAI
jgi:carbon storage regulator CsrA